MRLNYKRKWIIIYLCKFEERGALCVFKGFKKETIQFFLDLRFHNSKAFMDENRERYIKSVREVFYAFIEDVGSRMQKLDEDLEIRPHKCLSRINRDIRFTKDKSPYRDHLWLIFHKAATDKDGMPNFWFELGPDFTSWGMGTWGENRPMMDVMRRKMQARPDDFVHLVEYLYKNDFSIGGNAWKKMPVPENIPEVLRPLYLKKDLYISRNGVRVADALQKDIADKVYRDFEMLMPVYKMLHGCVDEAMNQLDEETGGKV